MRDKREILRALLEGEIKSTQELREQLPVKVMIGCLDENRTQVRLADGIVVSPEEFEELAERKLMIPVLIYPEDMISDPIQ